MATKQSTGSTHDTQREAIRTYLTPLVMQDYEQRGVFTELREPLAPKIIGKKAVFELSIERASEVHDDAEEQRQGRREGQRIMGPAYRALAVHLGRELSAREYRRDATAWPFKWVNKHELEAMRLTNGESQMIEHAMSEAMSAIKQRRSTLSEFAHWLTPATPAAVIPLDGAMAAARILMERPTGHGRGRVIPFPRRALDAARSTA